LIFRGLRSREQNLKYYLTSSTGAYAGHSSAGLDKERGILPGLLVLIKAEVDPVRVF
jgi:hypothetical protein